MERLTTSFVDYNREAAAVSVRVKPVSPQSHGAWAEDIDDLSNAFDNVTLGLRTKVSVVSHAYNMASPGAAATSPDSQRETKWIVTYYDTVNFRIGTLEIPNADLSLLQENSDLMDLSAGVGLTLKTRMEQHARSRDGNTIIVTSVRHVGRNI